jgi:ribosomal protein S18 acetylase RimI-like enzyme
MTQLPLRQAGWILSSASDADIDTVMTWFPDEDSVVIWGGPEFRYPFTAATFREDCRIGLMDSYCLRSPAGELAAFGQSYERNGRGHLARLVSNPACRGAGAGKRLIEMIIAALAAKHDYDEYSLFVFRHNQPAYLCYLSSGFVVRDYPGGAPLQEQCYFLTKRRSEQ